MAQWVLGHKISPQTVSGNYDLVIGETPPHTPGPPPHLHHTYHEVFLVTEGEMEFLVDGKPMIVKKGESVNLSPEMLHTFSNNSDNPCAWVNIHSPKGFLKFFNDFGIPETDEDAFAKSVDPKVIGQVLETAAQYDMQISL